VGRVGRAGSIIPRAREWGRGLSGMRTPGLRVRSGRSGPPRPRACRPARKLKFLPMCHKIGPVGDIAAEESNK
jgi:hypothetical protein